MVKELNLVPKDGVGFSCGKIDDNQFDLVIPVVKDESQVSKVFKFKEELIEEIKAWQGNEKNKINIIVHVFAGNDALEKTKYTVSYLIKGLKEKVKKRNVSIAQICFKYQVDGTKMIADMGKFSAGIFIQENIQIIFKQERYRNGRPVKVGLEDEVKLKIFESSGKFCLKSIKGYMLVNNVGHNLTKMNLCGVIGLEDKIFALDKLLEKSLEIEIQHIVDNPLVKVKLSSKEKKRENIKIDKAQKSFSKIMARKYKHIKLKVNIGDKDIAADDCKPNLVNGSDEPLKLRFFPFPMVKNGRPLTEFIKIARGTRREQLIFEDFNTFANSLGRRPVDGDEPLTKKDTKKEFLWFIQKYPQEWLYNGIKDRSMPMLKEKTNN